MVNRRSFGKQAGAALAASLLAQHALPQTAAPAATTLAPDAAHLAPSDAPIQHIGMLLYPGMYPLDLIGPHAFLGGLPNVKVHLLWKTLDPIAAGRDIRLTPTTTLADCPGQLEVIFVPGGTQGTILMLQDATVLDFLADRGSRAKYVTSVCTGSLILGAAGLLKGYQATSHWNTRDLLPLFGATPVKQRVVEDRNRITGGGVTSGMDFGLVLAERMRGRVSAQLEQLVNEYDPHPPFDAGTPDTAPPEVTAQIKTLLAPGYERTREAALIAQKRLGLA